MLCHFGNVLFECTICLHKYVAIQVLCNAMGVVVYGSARSSVTKVVWSNIISECYEGVGCQISRKKLYIRLKWPLCCVHFKDIIFLNGLDII